MKNTTQIVGWVKKKAFDGVIDGRKISSPEKIVLHIVQEVDNPDLHGKIVDTIKLPIENAVRINGGSNDFDRLIDRFVTLNYQIISGRAQLVDITLNPDKIPKV